MYHQTSELAEVCGTSGSKLGSMYESVVGGLRPSGYEQPTRLVKGGWIQASAGLGGYHGRKDGTKR